MVVSTVCIDTIPQIPNREKMKPRPFTDNILLSKRHNLWKITKGLFIVDGLLQDSIVGRKD